MSANYKLKWNSTGLVNRAEAAAMYGAMKSAYYLRAYIRNLIGVEGHGVSSEPGNPPHKQTGQLYESIKVTVSPGMPGSTGEAIVYTDSPYWVYLEYGTSKMAPRPFWRRSIEETKQQIQRVAENAMRAEFNGTVKNPGSQEFQDAYKAAKDAFFEGME